MHGTSLKNSICLTKKTIRTKETNMLLSFCCWPNRSGAYLVEYRSPQRDGTPKKGRVRWRHQRAEARWFAKLTGHREQVALSRRARSSLPSGPASDDNEQGRGTEKGVGVGQCHVSGSRWQWRKRTSRQNRSNCVRKNGLERIDARTRPRRRTRAERIGPIRWGGSKRGCFSHPKFFFYTEQNFDVSTPNNKLTLRIKGYKNWEVIAPLRPPLCVHL